MAQRPKQVTVVQAAYRAAEEEVGAQVLILSLTVATAAQALAAKFGSSNTSKTRRQAAALPVMV
jgi:hypothetical protein